MALLTHLLTKNAHNITPQEIQELGGRLTQGYSGADTTNLAREASMGPLREMMRSKDRERSTTERDLRPMEMTDFIAALRSVKASVSQQDLAGFERWNEEFGTQSSSI